MASQPERELEKLMAHPLFLQAVGMALNLNSYRKAILNRALRAGWKFLQLPNKRDQERTLHLIHELNHRIAELETRLAAVAEKPAPLKSRPAPLKTKPASVARSELRSV